MLSRDLPRRRPGALLNQHFSFVGHRMMLAIQLSTGTSPAQPSPAQPSQGGHDGIFHRRRETTGLNDARQSCRPMPVWEVARLAQGMMFHSASLSPAPIMFSVSACSGPI
jgi:hypothetical protein